jgi:hypothetical protein
MLGAELSPEEPAALIAYASAGDLKLAKLPRLEPDDVAL